MTGHNMSYAFVCHVSAGVQGNAQPNELKICSTLVALAGSTGASPVMHKRHMVISNSYHYASSNDADTNMIYTCFRVYEV